MSLGPRTTVALLVAVNLLAGGAGAIALDRTFVRAEAHAPGGGKCFERLRARLELDQQQAEKVRAILDARRPEFRRLMDESRERLDRFRKETDQELAKILRPDQLTKLADYRREQEPEPRIRHGH